MAAQVVPGIVCQLYLNEPAIIYVRSLKNLGKGCFGGRGQRVLHIISLNTLVVLIRVPKACTTGE